MSIRFTPSQQKVLDARNHNILVSAAAGSGKTAVLVERIVRLISEGEHPLDIDRLLVVTFTRAAAAQMRERLGQAISERLRRDPGNAHLQRQEILLHNAQITTIDSFCTFLLRNYFSDIDLDPGFRQIDQTEGKIIAADVLQDFLEEKYAEKDPAFLRCVEYFCPGNDDRLLETLILKMCEHAGSHPSPQAWLQERAADYNCPDEKALFSAPWMQAVIFDAAQTCMESWAGYEAMKEICRQPQGPDVCLDFFTSEQDKLFGRIMAMREQIEACRERLSLRGNSGPDDKDIAFLKALWEEIRRTLSSSYARYPNVKSKKYDYMDPNLRDAAKAMRDSEKERISALGNMIGGHSVETILAMMASAREPVETLSALALAYREKLQEAKKERHQIDFSDLEHFALDILAERLPDGSYRPRRAARSLRDHFAEILIDEYQDSNEVQELLLQIISGEDEGRNNRFMVGDIKQSIYRFRLARPEIFMEKYDSYLPDDAENEKIELDQNFRSRREVLDCVNALFMRIMRREIGGVAYSQEVSLKLGAQFPDQEETGGKETEQGREAEPKTDPSPYTAELLLLDVSGGEDSGSGTDGASNAMGSGLNQSGDPSDQEYQGESGIPEEAGESDGIIGNETSSLTARQKEALLIAGRIREMVGRLPVRDDESGLMRPARYGDIVILLRSTVGWLEDLRAVLAREGIPAYAESRTGYFAAEEIREVIALLRVIDNPRQDIPLYGALRGYFGGFSQDDITMIRLTNREGMLYDALCETAEDSGQPELAGRCRDFLAFLNSWRRRVLYAPISEIVPALLEETGFQDYCTALPAGAQRTANLRFLKNQADAFARTDYTGLFHFLRYIDGLKSQEIDYGEANTLDENADVVRIMSIHKSKGLEFPICFVSGLSGKFSFRRFDASGPMLFDSDWGIGIQYFDPASRVRSSDLRREQIAEKIRRDCMGEELRVLYVALTRAKEKLIMTAAIDKLDEKLEKWETGMSGYYHIPDAVSLPPGMIAGASSFAETICRAVMAHQGPDHECEFPALIRKYTQDDLDMQSVEDQLDLARCGEILDSLERHSLNDQPDPEAAEKLADRLFRVYPHEDLRDLYAQTSVSEIKHRAMQEAAGSFENLEGGNSETSAMLFPDVTPVPYVPAFVRKEPLQQESGSSENEGTRRGTAFHRVLELMDYGSRQLFLHRAEDGTGGREALQTWINSLADRGAIDSAEAALVSVERVLTFLNSPLAARMENAWKENRLYREQPFVMGCPADEVIADAPASLHAETVTVQGIIDAFLIENDRIILVDYKTDRVDTEDTLILRYRTQLSLYADALERAFGLPVAQKIIYSTALGREIVL